VQVDAISVSKASEQRARPNINFGALRAGEPFNPTHLFSGVFVPDVLLRYRGLSPTEKFIWARLARYGGDNGFAFPSVPTLAGELGLSDRQVQRGLAALERERFIRRDLRKTEKGDYTSTVYVFLLHPIFLEALATLASESRGLAARNGVVTDMSPGGERIVTTKIKRRLEEKTSSSPPSASTPSSPTPSQDANRLDDDKPTSEKAELIELIQESTGLAPDRRLVRDITEQLELRCISLREYLDDTRPRLERLKHPPHAGFFLHLAKRWGDSRPAEKAVQPASRGCSRCTECSGSRRTLSGYCTGAMGRDLAIVEKKNRVPSAEPCPEPPTA